MSVHTYDVNDDFSGAVFLEGLKEEIETAGLPEPSVIQMAAQAVSLYFEPDLDAGQVTTLDGVVAAHTGVSRQLRIMTMVHPGVAWKHHHDINYKTELTTKLQPERIFSNKGELTTVNWYASYDGTDFSDLVLRVDCVYTRDPYGYVIYRTTTRTWFCDNDSSCLDTKVTVKWYPSQQDKFEEAKTKRSNNLNTIQAQTFKYMLEVLSPQALEVTLAQGVQWMHDRQVEMSAYVGQGHPDLHDSVVAATDAWLDMSPAALGSDTIRDYILAELS